MKKTVLIPVIAVMAAAAFSCNSSTKSDTNNATADSSKATVVTQKTDTVKKVVYTCPMHPEVLSDTAGTCSKCGMALEVKK